MDILKDNILLRIKNKINDNKKLKDLKKNILLKKTLFKNKITDNLSKLERDKFNKKKDDLNIKLNIMKKFNTDFIDTNQIKNDNIKKFLIVDKNINIDEFEKIPSYLLEDYFNKKKEELRQLLLIEAPLNYVDIILSKPELNKIYNIEFLINNWNEFLKLLKEKYISVDLDNFISFLKEYLINKNNVKLIENYKNNYNDINNKINLINKKLDDRIKIINIERDKLKNDYLENLNKLSTDIDKNILTNQYNKKYDKLTKLLTKNEYKKGEVDLIYNKIEKNNIDFEDKYKNIKYSDEFFINIDEYFQNINEEKKKLNELEKTEKMTETTINIDETQENKMENIPTFWEANGNNILENFNLFIENNGLPDNKEFIKFINIIGIKEYKLKNMNNKTFGIWFKKIYNYDFNNYYNNYILQEKNITMKNIFVKFITEFFKQY